jgi:cell division protein FtsL
MAIEIHFEKRISNVAIVRDVDTRQQRQYMLFTLLSALFVMGLLFYGWQQYRWIQTGYALESAQKEKEELLELNRRFSLERDSLSALSRIDQEARNTLGMGPAAAGQIVTFKHEAPLTLPPATDAPALALAAKE